MHKRGWEFSRMAGGAEIYTKDNVDCTVFPAANTFQFHVVLTSGNQLKGFIGENILNDSNFNELLSAFQSDYP